MQQSDCRVRPSSAWMMRQQRIASSRPQFTSCSRMPQRRRYFRKICRILTAFRHMRQHESSACEHMSKSCERRICFMQCYALVSSDCKNGHAGGEGKAGRPGADSCIRSKQPEERAADCHGTLAGCLQLSKGRLLVRYMGFASANALGLTWRYSAASKTLASGSLMAESD